MKIKKILFVSCILLLLVFMVGIIVKGKKVSENPPILQADSMKNMIFTGTIGNIKISEIYKNESGLELKEGDTIPFLKMKLMIKQ